MVVTRAAAGSDSAQPIRYHVFLSFRGPDSRKTFTDHLRAALVRKGIVTFQDDQGIEDGDYIPDRLREAIRQSRYFVIVLSKEFASSSWCLDELKQILDTKPKRSIFPVFYNVQAGYIRRDEGGSLKQYKGQFPRKQIEAWRQALFKVAKIRGRFTENNFKDHYVEVTVGKIVCGLGSLRNTRIIEEEEEESSAQCLRGAGNTIF